MTDILRPHLQDGIAMTPFNVKFNSQDDQPIVIVRQNLSGGINSRQSANTIKDIEATVLYNVDIGIPGKAKKMPGSVLIGDDVGSNSILALHNYEIQGETDQLLMYEGVDLYYWLGAGNWVSLSSAFDVSVTEVGMISAKESGLAPDDIVIIQNGVDNAYRVDYQGNLQDLGSTAGTGEDSPPISTVMCWYGNRVWVLKDDLLYPSDAYSADYSTAFDTVGRSFRVPVGNEKGLVPTRDMGIIVMGENEIWSLAPSLVPDPSTDKPQPIITNRGVVSKKGWVNAGDDIYYFAQDGFRALKRTEQDKLQAGTEYPLSYFLKDEYERISWAYKDRICMEYFDNKIFIAVPTGVDTFDTWIYYTALKAFVIKQGWSPRCWAKYKIDGEEGLYYGKHGDGTVYKAWYGYTDEGTTTTDGVAINYQEEDREEDMGQPLVKKLGAIVGIKAQSSGNYDLSIYAAFDGGEYTLLGYFNLTGAFLSFPLSFPISFLPANVLSKKFHLDSYGPWITCKLKIVHNAVNGTNDIIILERSLSAYPLAYEEE